MVHNIQRLQGESKNGAEMLVHGRERDDNFLDNFTFSNKAAFHNVSHQTLTSTSGEQNARQQ
jgi:hypothetical protein